MEIRPIDKVDHHWLEKLWIKTWGSKEMVSKGKKVQLHDQRGYVVLDARVPVGFITYNISEGELEISSLLSLKANKGIGRMLIDGVVESARLSHVNRIWVVTTNDNTHALAYYQKRGFIIKEIRTDVMKKYRGLKPEIPLTGENGIPIRDEIELEYML